MISGGDVLSMLIPNGGWLITGNDYEGIQFFECEPITKKEFEDGFKTCQTWLDAENAKKVAERQAILDRLGITADEAKLLLG